MNRVWRSVGVALAAGAMLIGVSACGGDGKPAADGKNTATAGSTGGSGGTGGGGSASAKPSVKPAPPKPSGPPMLLDTIEPLSGATVGVAMPVSIVFSKPVASSARAGIEKAIKISTSTPVTGAWHWFGPQRADFRPQTYWKPGTKVDVNAALTNVPDGNGRYGQHSYHHTFTVGSDDRASVSVKGHRMTVTHNGATVKTFPIDAGSPSFPSWDGTMAVIDKQKEVRMTSCSVGISCDKSSPDFYDLTLPWDVHLTQSGTYVHYSTGDPYPGHSYGSHGCVHLSLADAKWFYNFIRTGDPITITGSPRGMAAGDNGYADFNLSWNSWLSGSGAGQMTTGTLAA